MSEEILELQELPTGYISYSQIRMYKRCPMQYKLRYVDGLKMKPKGSLILGVGVHEGLTEGFKEKKERGGDDVRIKKLMKEKAVYTIEEFVNKKEQDVGIDWGDDTKEIVIDDSARMIDTYYDEVGKKIKPKEVAQRFEIEFENVEWKLVGEVDIVEKKVVDWKTTARRYAEDYFVFDEQLKIYKLVHNLATEIHAIVRKKKDVEIQLLRYDYNVTTELLKDVEKVVTLIKTGIFYKTNDYMKCSWCGFKEICQRGGK